MIEHIIIIGLCVFAIWYTMQEGEIFEGLGNWFYKNIPKPFHQPVFECPVCMVPYYGWFIYLFLWKGSVKEIIFTLMATMGFNYILNKIGGTDTAIGSGINDEV